MPPFDLLASVPSSAVAVMLALVALAFLAYAPALMAPTPLNRILRAIRRFDGARSGSFEFAVGGVTANGMFATGRNIDGSMISATVTGGKHPGRFLWNADGTTLIDGRHLTPQETRARIEAGACGEAWMQSLLAVVGGGRLRLGAAVRAFVSALGLRVADVRRAATRFVLTGPWRDGMCGMNAFGLAGVARARIGDNGIVVDAGDGDVVTADWMVSRYR
ncbi:hypothetical protein JS528_01140 [Bifidobacterium sp. MA2]|uniref:Uncharacterized protein n=1 Tax=Bifidobacterium santillanense TaxID=2809028 RepID=A0ABS5UMG9_9BIFI|nr:hypothetical protein [Bifidobacterium santillanense]MBT1171985.1 hypothetical protein [Bifidobacterium santillanense]